MLVTAQVGALTGAAQRQGADSRRLDLMPPTAPAARGDRRPETHLRKVL